MEGTVNAQGQVEKVRTWIDQPIVGDMLIETTYSGYKDFSGLQLPSRLVQTQDGYPAYDITVSAVTVNPPPTSRCRRTSATSSRRRCASSRRSWPRVSTTDRHLSSQPRHRNGRPHRRRRHAAQPGAAEAVLAKAKELIPNKPIRYVVTSHHHWDHLGGIRARSTRARPS